MADGVATQSSAIDRYVERQLSKAEVAAQERAEMSVVSKAVHSMGGEAKLFDIVSTGKTLDEVLELLGVSRRSFDRWLQRVPDRAAMFSRARAIGADSMADQTLRIADAAEPETAQVAKLRIDARKWMAAKINPDVYGDRQGPLVQLNLGDMALDALRRRIIEE